MIQKKKQKTIFKNNLFFKEYFTKIIIYFYLIIYFFLSKTPAIQSRPSLRPCPVVAEVP